MLKIHNTLSRENEVFKPFKDREVKFFCCGPTTYDLSHIGHAKTYVQFDIIVKYLRFLGYKVFYLQNITNIDDKIIQRAKEEDVDWKEITRRYEKEYLKDMKNLNVDSVNKYARATDYIKEIKSQVKRLLDKGHAYGLSDGYYFDLTTFDDYGKLSGRTTQSADDGISRIDENKEKKNKGDFCLWKFSKKDEPSWEWSLGNGRSGWHIEDTAITEKEFGPQYDIHGGSMDLIFPHHEAEIAQMESISGKRPLVKYWMHTAFLNIDGKRMGKSLKNFITIGDVLKEYDGKVVRYFFASHHYRTPIKFSYELLEQSKNSLGRLNDFMRNLKENPRRDDVYLIEKTKSKFINFMNDDFNTPKAIAVIFDFIREVNKGGGGKKSWNLMLEFDSIFQFLSLDKEGINKEIMEFVKERESARKKKDWEKADEIRRKIKDKGYIVEDSKKGPKLKKIDL